MNVVTICLLIALLLLAVSASDSSNMCSQVLAGLAADAQPKRAMLRLAALENDVESACLLLQHGHCSVNEVDEYADRGAAAMRSQASNHLGQHISILLLH